MDKKQALLTFIKKHKIAVMSTIGQNKPQSAVMEFGETENLELIFDTFINSRKYKNLQQNKYVSFVIGWDEDITIQYEGEAEQIKPNELEKYQKEFFSKNPDAEKWKSVPEIVFFKVTPKWIRYSNLNKHPWEIFEVTF